MIIQRQEYLDKISRWRDKNIVKVISGVRRSGKSTVLELYRKQLVAEGVDEKSIISINFEEIENEKYKDYRVLNDFVIENLTDAPMNYLFLDEIQEVPQFERVVSSLLVKKNIDIYITGSNAFFMSSELATLLSGRTIEIQILPLTFAEYSSAHSNLSVEHAFKKYMEIGGFPYLTEHKLNTSDARDYLKSIYNTVVLKDVVERKHLSDVSLLEKIAKYLSSNIGNLTSHKKIADTLTSNGTKTSVNTVDKYVGSLSDALLFYSVDRYNVKGKETLKSLKKYYVVDAGLRHILSNSPDSDFGFILENIVYLELLKRGYDVYVGKYNEFEIDFVAKSKTGKIEYIQVALSIKDKNVLDRELRPLKLIRDSFSKKVLSLDNLPAQFVRGIEVCNAIDWLLGKND